MPDVTQFMINLVESLGYVGVALLVTLENVFPPIPSELVLALAGFVASRGDASLVGMIIAATVGSLAGAWILYGVAAAIGHERVDALVLRYGRWVRISESDLRRAERWFDDRSTQAVLICRCIPLVRSLISVPAGFRRMPFVRFSVYTTIGSAIWNTIFIVAGFQLGERWAIVEEYAGYFKYAVVAVILAAIVIFIISRFRVRSTARSRSGALSEPHTTSTPAPRGEGSEADATPPHS